MSLLFDALKRAQGDGNKPMPDASPHNGNNETMPKTEGGSATTGLRTRVLPYAIAGLVLLTGGLSWFFYQQNQHIPVATEQVDLAALSLDAASQVVAVSGIAETIATLPATASGADNLTYKDKSWTRPVETKKQAKRKTRRKTAQPGIQPDPLQLAYLALSEGRLDQAEHNYLAALARQPHEKDALLGLAVIAQRKMQTERAAELYGQVLREDLGNVAAAAGLVSLSVPADPLAAESQLRELIDLKPTAAEFHYALGGVLAAQQRWGEAQQAYFRACSLKPDNALYAYNLAVSLDHLHQPAAALARYEQASRLSKPRDPAIDQGVIRRRIQELKGGQ
ncbi:MAG: tetratricopeptide repeat protein [Gallionella sp.]|nr:tetratricopeptide repeat protein [Gallionella sp.]MDP1942009.1 tetratricopeptide repeat protein [Gallionella sp.]